jgi:hypothetical protein
MKQTLRQQGMAVCMQVAKDSKTIAAAMIAQNCALAVWRALSCSACICEREWQDDPPSPIKSGLLHSCLLEKYNE